jgi:hypothetical protein
MGKEKVLPKKSEEIIGLARKEASEIVKDLSTVSNLATVLAKEKPWFKVKGVEWDIKTRLDDLVDWRELRSKVAIENGDDVAKGWTGAIARHLSPQEQGKFIEEVTEVREKSKTRLERLQSSSNVAQLKDVSDAIKDYFGITKLTAPEELRKKIQLAVETLEKGGVDKRFDRVLEGLNKLNLTALEADIASMEEFVMMLKACEGTLEVIRSKDAFAGRDYLAGLDFEDPNGPLGSSGLLGILSATKVANEESVPKLPQIEDQANKEAGKAEKTNFPMKERAEDIAKEKEDIVIFQGHMPIFRDQAKSITNMLTGLEKIKERGTEKEVTEQLAKLKLETLGLFTNANALLELLSDAGERKQLEELLNRLNKESHRVAGSLGMTTRKLDIDEAHLNSVKTYLTAEIEAGRAAFFEVQYATYKVFVDAVSTKADNVNPKLFPYETVIKALSEEDIQKRMYWYMDHLKRLKELQRGAVSVRGNQKSRILAEVIVPSVAAGLYNEPVYEA